ncbi:MAG: nitroreductase family protein [Solobacterium sp.]|nr:nitroreductase family protein [Solobacterium sp.]
MTFMELAEQRYSVRHYKDQPVEEEKIQKILQAGNLAPSAFNYQPQKIYVLRSEEAKEKLRSVTRMLYDAPIAFVVCYDENVSWKNTVTTFGQDYDGGEMDNCVTGTYMMMEATELGLGTCWVRGFNTDAIHDALGLPENIKVSFIMDCGYESETSTRHNAKKKSVEETTEYL